jgi:deoxycytidine triphosphate deaminase
VREARWFWKLPKFFKKLVWLELQKPNPWNVDNENLFWQRLPKKLGSKDAKDNWYWLWPNEFVLLSAKQKITIPLTSAGILVSTSSSGRVGFNHSHAGWFDPGFEGYPTFEYSNIAKWPIPLWEDLRTIQLVMFDLNDAAKLGYGKTGRYQNQSIIPQGIKYARIPKVKRGQYHYE